jgi:WS/DGAT/MGAT family acyltransferase
LRDVVDIAAELANSVSLSNDPITCFRGTLGSRKQVAWAKPLELNDVKAISKALGCTVNDLLITAVTGALHTYMLNQGENPATSLEIRATVPVNLRPLEHSPALGNFFGLVFLPLPIGEPNPLRRLHRIRTHMNDLKSSRQAVVSFGLLSALGVGPALLQKPALELFSRKASTVLTNVPGPDHPMYIAGSLVTEMMFWVPQTGDIGMGISILSYNGKVYFGLITDRKIIPRPAEVIQHFGSEFEKLLYLTLMTHGCGSCDPDAAERLVGT